MRDNRSTAGLRVQVLAIFLIVHCAATLFHFTHNAVFIDQYPNLPGWITVQGIYVSWLGITSIGLVGYLLYRHGIYFAGLVTVAVYGALGFDGLAHYRLAPLSAHSFTMNLTIVLEALTAIAVIIVVMKLAYKQLGTRNALN